MTRKRRLSTKQTIVFAIIAVAVIIAFYFIYPYILKYLGDDTGRLTGIPTDGKAAFHFIDVGQGDSTLVELPSGKTLLIDAGPGSSENDLVLYLKSRKLQSITYMILSHPHEDHIGGAVAVMKNFEVENVIMPDVTTTTSVFRKLLEKIDKDDINLITAGAGDEFDIDGLKISMLGPVTIDKSNLNNCSLVFTADYGNTSFMFTGDAEKASEKEILGKYSENRLKCDVLKVGHHGSSTSSSKDFVSAVHPSIAVISVAKINDYGHPHQQTLSTLNKAGIEIYRTDESGTVVILSDGTSLSVIAGT